MRKTIMVFLLTEKEVYLSVAESNFMQGSIPELSSDLPYETFLLGLITLLSLVGQGEKPLYFC